MELEPIVSHSVILIRRRDGKEVTIREGRAYGEEEEILIVSGHSRGNGIVIRVNGKETKIEGSFDDVIRIVEERFGEEYAALPSRKML